MVSSIFESAQNHCLNRGLNQKCKKRMANIIDPYETAHEPSHQDLQCLQNMCFGLQY